MNSDNVGKHVAYYISTGHKYDDIVTRINDLFSHNNVCECCWRPPQQVSACLREHKTTGVKVIHAHLHHHMYSSMSHTAE